MKIKVKKIGELPGFCREYYQNVENKRIYALQLPYDSFGVSHPAEWFSCNRNGGEPECPLRKDLEIEIIN